MGRERRKQCPPRVQGKMREEGSPGLGMGLRLQGREESGEQHPCAPGAGGCLCAPAAPTASYVHGQRTPQTTTRKRRRPHVHCKVPGHVDLGTGAGAQRVWRVSQRTGHWHKHRRDHHTSQQKAWKSHHLGTSSLYAGKRGTGRNHLDVSVCAPFKHPSLCGPTSEDKHAASHQPAKGPGETLPPLHPASLLGPPGPPPPSPGLGFLRWGRTAPPRHPPWVSHRNSVSILIRVSERAERPSSRGNLTC